MPNRPGAPGSLMSIISCRDGITRGKRTDQKKRQNNSGEAGIAHLQKPAVPSGGGKPYLKSDVRILRRLNAPGYSTKSRQVCRGFRRKRGDRRKLKRPRWHEGRGRNCGIRK